MVDDWAKTILEIDLIDGLRHGVCVSNLTYLIAKKLGLSDEECNNLAVAGMVHDIGKLRLSSYLYGRNSNGMIIEEIQYMRKHSGLGYEILKKYSYNDAICEAVLYHHENYDGSGYPDNLKAEKIPLGARIMRVADAFIALISERPYREAYDFDSAISIMIEDVKEYDMQVFLAFMDVIHEDGMLEKILSLSPAEVPGFIWLTVPAMRRRRSP